MFHTKYNKDKVKLVFTISNNLEIILVQQSNAIRLFQTLPINNNKQTF